MLPQGKRAGTGPGALDADPDALAIAPPSDIVLDVAQAADPLRLQAATSKLAKLAAGAGASSVDFDLHVQSQAVTRSINNALSGSTRLVDTPPPRTATGSPYQRFEAMVLQTFVQNILPKDENLFGDAASADVCRSLLAEQLATQLAKSGRLGIARMIEAAHPPVHAAHPQSGSSASSPVSGTSAPSGKETS